MFINKLHYLSLLLFKGIIFYSLDNFNHAAIICLINLMKSHVIIKILFKKIKQIVKLINIFTPLQVAFHSHTVD